jgi:DNA modification methylase
MEVEIMMLGKYEINKIYNEDSYKAIKDIPDNSIDCIYVDVPYLYKSGGAGKSEFGQRLQKRKDELNDLKIRDGFNHIDFIEESLRIIKTLNIFIWCSKDQIEDVLNTFRDKCKQKYNYDFLVWTKDNPPPMTNNRWLSDIEYCLHFRESGATMNDGYHLKSKYYNSPINKRDKDLFKHPTIKPLNLVKRHLEHATKENDIVADFFIGSGTTAVACKELNRNYIGFEISKEYHKIAVDRVNGITASGQTSIFTNFEDF